MSISRDVGSGRATVCEQLDLGKHYRPIGISAVAAALVSSGEHKNDVRARAVSRSLASRDIDQISVWRRTASASAI